MRGGMVYIEQEGREKTIFWNCPRKFIPDSIYGFKLIYDYYKGHPGAGMPEITDVSYRYLLAERMFESFIGEYQLQAIKDK